MKQKSIEFLLESWSAAGCPNVYWKAVPSCETSNTESPLAELQFFGRPFVKRFTLCYRSVVLSVCLSVTLVYCGQTVGRIKMKLGTHVGLGPGHIV